MIKSSKSFATLSLIFLAMVLVMAFIWWLVVYSPLGMRKAFEVMIDGEAMRSTFNSTFLVFISTGMVAAILSIMLSGLRRLQGK